MSKKQKRILSRIIVSSVFTVIIKLAKLEEIPNAICYLLTYLIIGYDILIKAAKGVVNGRIFDECFLMSVATLGAVALAVYSKSGDFFEAVAVMLFYQIGELFQSQAVKKSRESINALTDIRPDYANMERDGTLVRVDPQELQIGTVVTVQPGERIPIDGTVTDGESDVDTSTLTGESLPKHICIGENVFGGCINLSGVLKIKTEKEFSESAVSKILALTEESSNKKSKTENFISKFARYYTPAVCIAALILAFFPPAINLCLNTAADFEKWIHRALTFLVISCPCAFVISIPLTFFASLGSAGKAGILIKGSNFLEALASAKTVVFDKTGTLTMGVFEVKEINAVNIDSTALLEYAAVAECASSHPISQSLRRAYGKEINRNRVKNIKELSGNGITAYVDGISVAVGNARLMESLGIKSRANCCEGTVIHIALNGNYSGNIVISDSEKPNSKSAIYALKSAGIDKTVMLTGDTEATAKAVASSLGIDEVRAELLPDGKVKAVEKLLFEKKGTLVFVGDGINDAPVISRADIGVAMGALGSDAAIEAADVVLTDDDPIKIATAIKISKKCLGIVYQNTVFAIGIKFAFLILGAFGISSMGSAVFADVGVTVIAILNAVRALKVPS